MKIELSRQSRADAVASIQRYFDENMPGGIGELPAGMVLNYFLEEIAPVVYNKAIADAQGRMQQRALDLSGELFSDEWTYWARLDAKRKRR
jgi:uncharacterized protein (DUF2164 family)